LTQLTISSTKSKTVGGQSITITGASNASPIAITATGHGLETGDIVQNSGVGGNLAANGQFVITKTGANSFTLNNSNGSGAYTSGGAAAHVGYSVSPDLSAPAWGNVPTNVSVIFLLKSAPATGASLRFVFEDATDAAFLSAMPIMSGAFSGGTGPSYSRRFDSRFQDAPDWVLQPLNDYFRLRVLWGSPTAGQVYQFASWMEY
jgi:hypothetical protein